MTAPNKNAILLSNSTTMKKKEEELSFTTDLKHYFGGKNSAGVRQTIINQVPPHETWVSGFLGNCAPTRYKRRAKHTIGFDLDTEIIDEWSKNDGIELRNECFIAADTKFLSDASAFVFLDPPYLFETRKGKRHRYKFEMTEEQHRQLLSKISAVTSKVMICTYPSKLYKSTLKDWRIVEYHSSDRKNNKRVEWLMMNYSEPTTLHDYRFLGDDYRERERIEKQYNNAIKKFKGFSPIERNMILDTLVKEFKNDIALMI